MKPIRVVIVDDEPLARENMQDLLQRYPEVVIVGEAGTIDEAREVLKRAKPDAVFLDIQMPGGTGFDVLSGLDLLPHVVFVTAYDEYAVRAFQVNAVDYLLKPIDRSLLAGAVARLTAGSSPAFRDQLLEGPDAVPFRLDDDVLVNEKGRYFFVPLRTVYAIRARGNYTEALVSQNQIYLFRQSLKFWHARLPIPPFLPLDRSLIINADLVCGWQSRHRGLEVLFQSGAASVVLGRAAFDRFRKSVEEARYASCENRTSKGKPKPT